MLQKYKFYFDKSRVKRFSDTKPLDLSFKQYTLSISTDRIYRHISHVNVQWFEISFKIKNIIDESNN